MVNPADLLTGWQEIADYVGRSPSWCKYMASEKMEQRRLPVVWLGSGRGRPTASRENIKSWLADWLSRDGQQ